MIRIIAFALLLGSVPAIASSEYERVWQEEDKYHSCVADQFVLGIANNKPTDIGKAFATCEMSEARLSEVIDVYLPGRAKERVSRLKDSLRRHYKTMAN